MVNKIVPSFPLMHFGNSAGSGTQDDESGCTPHPPLVAPNVIGLRADGNLRFACQYTVATLHRDVHLSTTPRRRPRLISCYRAHEPNWLGDCGGNKHSRALGDGVHLCRWPLHRRTKA